MFLLFGLGDDVGEVGDEVGGPGDRSQADRPGRSWRGGAERECDFGQAQLEQPVAAPRLAVIVALGRRPARISIWRSLRPKRR
jgi:hypothetical protein